MSEEANSIGLKQMENGGFEQEENGATNGHYLNKKVEVRPTAPTPQDACVPPQTVCACIEKQALCSCAASKSAKPQTELLTWVKPKGWILLGTGVALAVWAAIFFTLSALGFI